MPIVLFSWCFDPVGGAGAEAVRRMKELSEARENERRDDRGSASARDTDYEDSV